MEALPPPYRTSKETEHSPYDAHESAAHYAYATELPAFDAPRRYSSRLRRLLQQRSSSRGVYLTLHIPHALSNCRLISIESASSCSSSVSSSSASVSSSSSTADDNASISTNETDGEPVDTLIHYVTTSEKTPLLYDNGTPFVDDLEAGVVRPKLHSSMKSKSSSRSKKSSKRVKFKKDPKHRHRDKHAYRYLGIDDERETSWLTFFLLLLLIFTMACAAGVLIAWALGFSTARATAAASPSSVATVSVTEVTQGRVVPQSPAVVEQISGAGPGAGSEKAIEAREATGDSRDKMLSRVWRNVRRDLMSQEKLPEVRPRSVNLQEQPRHVQAIDIVV